MTFTGTVNIDDDDYTRNLIDGELDIYGDVTGQWLHPGLVQGIILSASSEVTITSSPPFSIVERYSEAIIDTSDIGNKTIENAALNFYSESYLVSGDTISWEVYISGSSEGFVLFSSNTTSLQDTLVSIPFTSEQFGLINKNGDTVVRFVASRILDGAEIDIDSPYGLYYRRWDIRSYENTTDEQDVGYWAPNITGTLLGMEKKYILVKYV